MHWLTVYFTIGWIIALGMIPVILRRELTPGASLAWLGIVFLHPYIGLTLYMLVGETRLGPRRLLRHRELIQKFRYSSPAQDSIRFGLPEAYEPMILQVEKISGMPIVGGNDIEFLPTSLAMVDRLTADIARAVSHIHLLYYIWFADETGNRVADALIAAAGRGVKCRVLVDAVASRQFLRRKGLVHRLRDGGVEVAAALPVAPVQRRLPRMDLRNHRKLGIIDDRIGYVGSHNLINPDYGGRRGAPWVDVTGRLTGPVVAELAAVFAEDWAFETGRDVPVPAIPAGALDDGLPMQVIPTGPSAPGESYRRVFLGAIQSARSRIVLTTPYFVPDEPTLISLMMAADRGVDVKLIIPEHPDHILAAAAGRAHFSRLLQAGVTIHQYRPGLIHSKTVTIDDAFGIMGSANIDVRSFNLNFELSVILYGREITDRLRAIQLGYLADCDPVDLAAWPHRPLLRRYVDNAVALFSPLL